MRRHQDLGVEHDIEMKTRDELFSLDVALTGESQVCIQVRHAPA
jgi:hypothetical protein